MVFIRQSTVVAVAIVLAFAADSALAQKKGTSPGGQIYYSRYDGATFDYVTMRVNPDGSNQTQVMSGVHVGEASHALHAGKRWFIDAEAHGIRIVSDAGDVVPVLSDPDLTLVEAPHWQRLPVDGGISFRAELWATDPGTGNSSLLDEGIFFVKLQYDSAGAPVGAVPDSLQMLVASSDFGGSLTGHDWGSDGRLVFSLRDAGVDSGLWIADLTLPEASRYTWVPTGADRVISVPAWSPDGSRIAFNENSTGIVILTLANGRRKTIPNSATHGVGTAHWSPAGDGLIYHRGRYGTDESELYRAAPDGSGRTLVVSGTSLGSLGWRN